MRFETCMKCGNIEKFGATSCGTGQAEDVAVPKIRIPKLLPNSDKIWR